MMAHPTTHVIDITAGSSGSNDDDVGAASSNSSWWNNPRLWICGEVVFVVSEIVAAFVVLSFSSNHDENPNQRPLYFWINVYAWVCVSALPLLCWRFYFQDSPNNNIHESWLMDLLSSLVLLLDFYLENYFLVIWFFAGIFVFVSGLFLESGHEAPGLYWLFRVFIIVMFIRLVIGVRKKLAIMFTQTPPREEATPQWINALPTYKFKINNSEEGGGVIAAGTEKERMISQEDAVCCICLAKYKNKDELRELLACSHLFHKDCVDMWLKIKALCPLCKSGVGENNVTLTETVDIEAENART